MDREREKQRDTMNNLGQTVDVDLRESSLDGTGKPRKDAKRILDGFGARKAYGRASAWGIAKYSQGFRKKRMNDFGTWHLLKLGGW